MAWFSMARRVSAAAFLSPLLAACASSTVTQEDAARIHTIGVISSCGEKLDLLHIGVTVFTNSEDIASIRDWNMDGRIIENIKRELGGRYDIRPVTYDPADFSYDSEKRFMKYTSPGTSVGSVGDLVRDHAKPEGGPYDAYIVLTPQTIPANQFDTRDVYIVGTGIYDMSFLA